MGDQNTVLTAVEARHLLRRTGFGAPPAAVNAILAAGETRGQAADRLLSFTPSRFKPGGRYTFDKHNKWVRYMLRTNLQLQEKLVIFWHDHFATSDAKVGYAKLMAAQNRLLRQFCKGNFRDFVKAINRDAAMMEFLDTVRNRDAIPNENYARELMELFTLGVKDFNGNANYLQEDIVQIARAFTGWTYEYRSGQPYLREYYHDFMADYPARGPKVIFKTVGGFGPAGASFTVNGEGEAEIDAVIDIIFNHRDTAGRSTVARHITRKLLAYFAHPNPDPAVVDAVIAESGFDTSWNLSALLRAIFVNDAFYLTAAGAPFDASAKKSVKWPIDYVVTVLRTLNVVPRSRYQYIEGGSYTALQSQLTNMGQTLFEPPSVFGWDWENAWLNSATLLARYTFARDVTSARYGPGRTAFHPEKLIDISLTDPGDIVDAVTDLLAVTDQLTAAERGHLIDYMSDNGANPSIDLTDEEVRNRKLNGLFALVLQCPAYQLH